MRWRDFDNLTPLPDTFFAQPRRVHFIGIGGIGMSALAFVLRSRGHHISGSDANDSAMLAKLREVGVLTSVGHNAENLSLHGEPTEAIIWGSAITPANPEMQAAQASNIPQWHRAQLLAHFVNSAKQSIAVSGTHGKSTTSAMAAHILERCGKNPTAILGAEYPPFGSNARIGDPDLVVVEADESDGSFTLLKPDVAVITNIEPEHLENYDDNEEQLWRAFEQFAQQAHTAVINKDDNGCIRLISAVSNPVCYSLKNDVPCAAPQLNVPGAHNQSNALAAISATQQLDISNADAAKAVESFHGVGRRFQLIGEADSVIIYDDYAHHPTEVQSTLQAAREFLQRPLVVIYQPHRYSRTQQMGHLFGSSFAAADRIIITQLYSAFEEPIEGVSGRIVFDAVRAALPGKDAAYVESLDEARHLALELIQPGDAVLTMGAGDVSQLAPKLLQALKQRDESTAALDDTGSPPQLTQRDEPLSRHTTMKVGGPAKLWAEPDTEAELVSVLRWTQQNGFKLQVLGAGSNLVASDEGFDGVVLKLGRGFEWQRTEGHRLITGGATLLPKLTKFALQHRLGNMEWACGVPGSVGGSIWGNAGARGFNGTEFESRDAAADLESLVAYDRNGQHHVLQRSDIEFSYRRSSLGELIVTEATFALKPLSEAEARRHRQAVKDLLKRRRETQPANAASAGCVWKNPDLPDCAGAGALIEKLGLKGLRVGGAAISEVHANFVINTGNATAADVRELMRVVEEKVRQATGVQLEREVRFL